MAWIVVFWILSGSRDAFAANYQLHIIFHDCSVPMMQAASNDKADDVERAFLQILLQSLNSSNKEVSVQCIILELITCKLPYNSGIVLGIN